MDRADTLVREVKAEASSTERVELCVIWKNRGRAHRVDSCG
jgi:hypothetical protein